MRRYTRLIASFITCATCSLLVHAVPDDDELYLIEIEGFEVFSNSMKIIDGFTGKEYTGDHPVILGFRREFDNILTKYHHKLLLDEAKKLKARADTIKPFTEDLAELASSFGIKDFEVKGPHLTREISIFKRMVRDPFFHIEELVVWDLSKLERLGGDLPNNKYSKNIRFNEETRKWERRVTTKWEVSWVTPDKYRRHIYKYKEQGLNLETHKGYHIVHGGLRPDVPTEAFQDVDLQYPIFFNTGEPIDAQIENLNQNFVINLFYIYDPYSWVVRGNTRFRGGFSRDLEQHIKTQTIPVNDREWFDRVLADFLNDIIAIKYWGTDEIYDHLMVSLDNKNKNQLGVELDLLNWYKKETREVDYDVNQPNTIPQISFDNRHRARFILLDAYRRYGDKFTTALRQRILALNPEERVEAKQLIKHALEEASEVSAEKYIPAAIKAQQIELQRFQRVNPNVL